MDNKDQIEYTYVLNLCEPNQDNTFVSTVFRTSRIIDIIKYIHLVHDNEPERISISFEKRKSIYNSSASHFVNPSGLAYEEYDIFVTAKQDVNGHIKQKYIVTVFQEESEYNDD